MTKRPKNKKDKTSGQEFSIFDENGKNMEIPVEGSLGLLALGAVGVRAWRKKREECGYINPNTNIMNKNKPKDKSIPSNPKIVPGGGENIIVVSGLPRSGTSMMMQMLEKGGKSIFGDNVRKADEDNPRGYYEYEKTKTIKKDNSWLPEARGKVIKVVSPLLSYLPLGLTYDIIFMERNISEIMMSQAEMLKRKQIDDKELSDEVLAQVFLKQVSNLKQWLETQSNMRTLFVPYKNVIENPMEEAARLCAFLGDSPLEKEMASAVSSSLYRKRV